MQTRSELAESVRQCCIEAALEAYQNAGISGLCAEGRWELAVQAMRCVDLRPVIAAAAANAQESSRAPRRVP